MKCTQINMPNIEITEEEYLDRLAIHNVKETYNPKEGFLAVERLEEGTKFYNMLFDVHSAMYPLHDILVRTKNIELKAYLGEVILKLNGIRAKLKSDSRTYA